MKPLWELDDPVNLQEFVIQELKNLGIKVPRTKKIKNQELPHNDSVFGNYLCYLPFVPVDNCGHVPRFLVKAVEFIEQFIDTEGLFRKSGALSRQKELKQQIELDKAFTDVQVFDVTGVVKQFFRELPDPLLTNKYHDMFIKCYQLNDRSLAASSILDLCLLLPGEHLGTLRYIMKFLARVADNSDVNKMDACNLAVVLGPNIMHVNTNKTEKMNASEEKLLQTQTAIVEFLIRNADKVGIVSKSLLERVELMENLQTEENPPEGKVEVAAEDGTVKKKRKKRRSSSLQGIVSNIAQSLAKWRTTPVKANSSQLSGHSSGSSENILIPDMTGTLPVITPKVMRKRKASGEALVFSATKKKAILMQMPQPTFTPRSAKTLPPEIQKALEKGTPIINFCKEKKIEFTATPEKKKTTRKRLSLFSPSGARKSKSWSVTTSSSSLEPVVVKEKKRGLFRRLSGGKSKVDSPSSGKQPLQQTVGERLASPAKGLRQTDQDAGKSHKQKGQSVVTRESPISALVGSSVRAQPEEGGSAERFFSPNKVERRRAHATQHTSLPGGVFSNPDPGIERSNVKLHLRTRSVEAALARGKPNTLGNGLNSGDIPLPLRVRREPLRRRCSRSKSLHTTSRRHLVIQNPYVSRSRSSRSFRRSRSKLLQAGNVSLNKSKTDQSLILEPPAEFADKPEAREQEAESDSDQSEAGFSTISGDTVIFVPSTQLSLEKECGDQSITRAVMEIEKRSGPRQPPEGGPVQGQGENNRTKSSSTNNLTTNSCTADTTVARSQSMYERTGKTHQAVPNLMVSTDTRNLLTRAGYVKEVEKVTQDKTTQENVAHEKGEADASSSVGMEGVAPIKRAVLRVVHHESVLNLKDNHSGNVADKKQILSEKQSLDRHTSPLRFAKSTTRTRGASPVRIPTIFAKGDSEAERFRQIAVSSLKGDGSLKGDTPVKRASANLPISTQLLRPSAEATRCSQADSKGSNSCRRKPSIYKVQTEPCRVPSVKGSIDRVRPHIKDITGVKGVNVVDFPSDLDRGLLEDTISGDSVFNVTPHPAGDFTDSAANNSEASIDLSAATGQMLHVGSPLLASNRFTLSASLQDTINEVCTPLSAKLKKSDELVKTQPHESNQANLPGDRQLGTPHIRQALLQRVGLRTASGMTPRHLLPRKSPGSPLKPVKRLGASSPKSSCRTPPRRVTIPCKSQGSGDGRALSFIPAHLQADRGENL